jgi:nitrate reductase gamma subunit
LLGALGSIFWQILDEASKAPMKLIILIMFALGGLFGLIGLIISAMASNQCFNTTGFGCGGVMAADAFFCFLLLCTLVVGVILTLGYEGGDSGGGDHYVADD